MAYVVAALVVLFVVALIAGAASGRMQTRSCCTVADPRKDLRMRPAFIDESEHD